MNSVEDLYNLGTIFEEFVYKKDLKRKQQDESPLLSPKRIRTIHSLDYESYRQRVASFTEPGWCRYTHAASCPLLPQHLARHGWRAWTEARLVKCVSCGAILYLGLPDTTAASRHLAAMVAKQEARVAAAHAEFCPWSASPCPVSWAAPRADTAELVATASRLLSLGTELPWVAADTAAGLRDGVAAVVAGLRTDADSRIAETAAVLAILGWQPGQLEDTLSDNFQARRIGLWNFVSIQTEMDRVEDLRVARELSGDVASDTDSSPKKKDDEGRKYFDPIKEHLVWNPIRVRDVSGVCGWEVVRDSFRSCDKTPTTSDAHTSAGISDSSRLEESDEKLSASTSTAKTVLSKVRELLDFW